MTDLDEEDEGLVFAAGVCVLFFVALLVATVVLVMLAGLLA